MSSITTSLNQLLAGNFAYVQRPTGPNTNSPSNNFGRELIGSLEPGTRVITQNEYVVNAYGKLQRTGSLASIAEQQSQASPLRALPTRPQSFADLSKPKAQLSPTEEAAIFDADTIEGGSGQNARRYVDSEGAEDENGAAVEVEILAPDANRTENASLAAQRQQKVSYLYARNNDIAYLTQPLLALAA